MSRNDKIAAYKKGEWFDGERDRSVQKPEENPRGWMQNIEGLNWKQK